jgi:SAM-dependent methyltransferase
MPRVHPAQTQREIDLVAYYDNEVRARSQRELPAERLRRRAAYLSLLEHEDRASVIEVGAGPGRDGQAFAAGGLSYTGVDLAPSAVAACRALGLDARVATVFDLPFDDDSFEAGWTMSTLLHVPTADVGTALAEIVRVLRPGAPLAIGVWGTPTDREDLWDDGSAFGPPRFFSMRSDDSWRRLLSAHGVVEEWSVWEGREELHYQWAVLRTPS